MVIETNSSTPCPKCGYKNPAGAVYCGLCYEPFRQILPPSSQAPKADAPTADAPRQPAADSPAKPAHWSDHWGVYLFGGVFFFFALRSGGGEGAAPHVSMGPGARRFLGDLAGALGLALAAGSLIYRRYASASSAAAPAPARPSAPGPFARKLAGLLKKEGVAPGLVAAFALSGGALSFIMSGRIGAPATLAVTAALSFMFTALYKGSAENYISIVFVTVMALAGRKWSFLLFFPGAVTGLLLITAIGELFLDPLLRQVKPKEK